MSAGRRRSRVRLLSVTLASFGSLIMLRACDVAPETDPTTTEAPMAAPMPADPVLADVLAQVNTFRAGAGVGQLTWSDPIAAAAARQSADIAARGSRDHVGTDGSTPKSRMRDAGYPTKWWAESVASGFSTASAVVWAWMNSEDHRNNLLNSQAMHVGIAVARSADGTPYWTIDLASGG